MSTKKNKKLLSNTVTINPKVQGGMPCIANTRVPVKDIVFLVKRKKISPEKIALKYYSFLSLFQIKKSLEWYELNNKEYGGLDL